MGIIKKIYWLMVDRYQICRFCKGERNVLLDKEYYKDKPWMISVGCSLCNGTGIEWGHKL